MRQHLHTRITPFTFEIAHLKDPSTRVVVTDLDYQRNGVTGEGFFILQLRFEGNILQAVVFDATKTVAVFNPLDLSDHYRGDNFEAGLRAAIEARKEEIWS